MNRRLTAPVLPTSTVADPWSRNLLRTLDQFHRNVAEEVNLQLPPERLRANASALASESSLPAKEKSIQAATTIYLNSSIQVVRSDTSTVVEIQTIYPPTSIAQAGSPSNPGDPVPQTPTSQFRGLAHLILWKDTKNFSFAEDSSGNLTFDLTVGNGQHRQVLTILYDGNQWFRAL